MAVNQTSTSNLQIFSRPEEVMDQWLLVVTSDQAAKGSTKDLEVVSAVVVHYLFPFPSSFLTMCSSERCLSFMSPWYIDHLN